MSSTGAQSGGVNQPLVGQSQHLITAETLDWIVEEIEERVLAELERRGLRFQPGVF